MLNTQPPTPAPLSPVSSPSFPRPPSSVPTPPRRRGGQPSNRNALKYGYFARRNPTPLTQTLNSISLPQPGLPGPLTPQVQVAGIVELLQSAIPLLRVQIARLFDTPPQDSTLRSVLSWHRPIIHLLGLFLRVNKSLARYQQPQHQLQFVAAHVLPLIRYDFRETCPPASHSFRVKPELRHVNSSNSHQSSELDSVQSRSQHKLPSPMGEGPGERSLPVHSFRGNTELRHVNSSNSRQNSELDSLQSRSQHKISSPMGDCEADPTRRVRVPVRVSRSEAEGGPGVGTLDNYSFRGKPQLRHFNSPSIQEAAFPPQTESPHHFLTPRQRALLEPLLSDDKLPSPTGEGLGVRGRGRPLSDPARLLDGILWKLAHHARWQDLTTATAEAVAEAKPLSKSAGFGEGSGEAPSMGVRSVRRRGPGYYYRSLSLTGRLLPLYTALYHDFLAHSGIRLEALIAQGSFTLSGTCLALSPAAPNTWQTRTALLLMQLAYQSYRRLVQVKR